MSPSMEMKNWGNQRIEHGKSTEKEETNEMRQNGGRKVKIESLLMRDRNRERGKTFSKIYGTHSKSEQ